LALWIIAVVLAAGGIYLCLAVQWRAFAIPGKPFLTTFLHWLIFVGVPVAFAACVWQIRVVGQLY
jgi:hypothetical protein